MHKINWFYRIYSGAVNSPYKLLKNIFVIYVTGWAIIEPILAIMPSASNYLVGNSRFIGLLIVSLIGGLIGTSRLDRIAFRYRNSDISILFGDLFHQTGIKSIPVSQFMYETEVIPSSLQSFLIKRYLAGEEGGKGLNLYASELDNALRGKHYEIVERIVERGCEKFFPVGTSALLKYKNDLFLITATTVTELEGEIPDTNCSVTNLWIALTEMWRYARVHARGKDMNIPLTGSGVTGINLEPIRILELNMLVLINSLEEGGKITTGNINLVLHYSYFDQIDLRDLQKMWSKN